MNTDAVLTCFKSGASIRDLASALAVDPGLIEQMVRETLAEGRPSRPQTATTHPPAPRPSPRVSAGPTVLSSVPSEKKGRPPSAPLRRSAEQIRAAVIAALEAGPLKIGDLNKETQTSCSVMLRLLRNMETTGEVSKGPDGRWSLWPSPAHRSAS